jgi:hypothetical protein
VKRIYVARGAASLADAIASLKGEPAAVLRDGRPVAVLLPVEGADLETVSLSLNPQFLAILERSRDRQRAEGGVSEEEMRRRLAADPAAAKRGKGVRKPRAKGA